MNFVHYYKLNCFWLQVIMLFININHHLKKYGYSLYMYISLSLIVVIFSVRDVNLAFWVGEGGLFIGHLKFFSFRLWTAYRPEIDQKRTFLFQAGKQGTN